MQKVIYAKQIGTITKPVIFSVSLQVKHDDNLKQQDGDPHVVYFVTNKSIT